MGHPPDAGSTWPQMLQTLLIPDLLQIPPQARAAAVQAAKDTRLDLFELLGMAAGLMLVTWLTRYALDGAPLATRFEAALANFVIAVPLLALFLGPFHLRRLRRGVSLYRRNRSSHNDQHDPIQPGGKDA